MDIQIKFLANGTIERYKAQLVAKISINLKGLII